MATKQNKSENKKIKFGDIKAMFEGGMIGLSSRTLDIANSYKVVQFKTKLKDAYDEFKKRHKQALQEVGIVDGNQFSNELNSLSHNAQRTEEENKKLQELLEQNKRFDDLFNKLLDDDYEIEPKTMPHEQWRALAEENKDLKFGRFELLAQFEMALEGILWAAPEEAN